MNALSNNSNSKITRTWQDVLNQVRKEATILKQPEIKIDQSLFILRTVILHEGCTLESPVEIGVIARLEAAISHGTIDADLITATQSDAATVTTALQALIRNYSALVHAHFGQLLKSSVIKTMLSLGKLGKACGATVEKVRFWIRDTLGGVTGMTADQAIKIDQTLGNTGEIVAAYCALRQDAAYAPWPSMLEKLTGRISFGARLLQWRQATGRTLDDLLDQLRVNHDIELKSAQLNGWERGGVLPSQDSREVILALDSMYGAGGAIISAWQAERPPKILEKYRLKRRNWPLKLERQFEQMVLYKTTNMDGLDRSNAAKGSRWGAATTEMFQHYCEAFFGFLTTEEAFLVKDLSLTLICDWRLVSNHFEWGRKRMERKHYSQSEFARTTNLLNLYSHYFPTLAVDAAEEIYWASKLPTEARFRIKVAPGVERDHTVLLSSFAERWSYFVAQTRQKAKSFTKFHKFTCDAPLKRAQPFLEAEISVSQIVRELEGLASQLPPRILSRKAAIQVRRLSESALLVAVSLRPFTIQTLKLDQVIAGEQRRYALAIPEEALRSRGMQGGKGGISGNLPDWPLLHRLIRMYLEEARPILLGQGNATLQLDQGYFFISAESVRRGTLGSALPPGGKLDDKAFYNDFILTLGFNPWAGLYVFAADAWRNGIPTDQIATFAHTTAANAHQTFGKILGPQHAEEANATVARFMRRQPKNRRRNNGNGPTGACQA